MEMPGISFVIDDQGEKRAVQIDLAIHHQLWEDIYDAYLVESRRGEPTENWEDVKRELGLDAS
ncbi:hypothetical protein Pla108_15750 [Botrimarina colliarenosi]|uniref:Uncharacterized protein n=1 Tax=Botrimarina colliarenosi TaxID=2528001 RepID=A0A5C6AKS5_9BACT|nr:hypothetical protein [Botrimarina colliarenosi]TWU00623.1 hypothetical protein Pla108_15750 [Botrimarina colliarenosi]